MDELQILLQAVLDEIKSLQSIQAQLEKIGNQVNLPISVELDIPKSLQAIKRDIQSLEKLHIDLSGRLNRTETRKALKKDLKALGNEEVTVRAKIDKAALKKSIKEAGGKAATIDIDTNVDGAEDLGKVSDGLDGINKKSAATVASVTLLNQALTELEQAAARMVQTSAAIDEQLTDIRMVTGDSYTDVIQLAQAYNALAKEIKATTSQVLEGSTEWLRQGMTAEETTDLIRQSMILSKVGAMDSASATKNLTSAMKGYELAVEDVSGVVDKLTAIDMEAAVSAADLAVAMSRTATGANLAGVSMDRLLGYLASVQETTQKSAETVGESLKTMFARMNNIKLGVFVDDDGESLNDTEKILKEFGIALRDTNDEFRAIPDVLDDIYARWDSFTTLEKSAIATAAAGTRQRENFLTLMEHYGEALEYAEVAANSAGTALQKFEAYQESLGAKLNNFTAAFESLSLNTFDPQFLGVLVDTGASVLSFIDSIHLLQSALIGLSAAGILKGFTMIASGVKNAYADVLKLSTAFDIMGKTTGVGVAADQMQTLLAVTKGLSASQLRLVVSNKALTNEQRMAILTSSGLTKEQAAQILSTMGLATAEKTATAATFSLSGAMKALGAAIVANPIGFLATALTAAISVIQIATGAIEDAKAATDELRQETISESEALTETVNSFKDAYVAAAQYGDRQTLTASEERDFQYAVEQAAAALGDKKLAIDDATASTQDYIEALKDASKEELRQAALKANDAADAARDAVQDAAYDYWAMPSAELVGFEMAGSNIEKKSEEYKKAWKIVLADMAEYAKEVGITAEKKTIFGTIEAVTEWHVEPKDFQSIDEIVAYYYDLVAVKDKLNEAGLRETTIYDAISKDVGKLDDVVGQYVKTEYDRLSLNYMYQKGIPDSMESFTAYRDYMQKSMGELFNVDAMPSIVDTYLSGETDQYAKYIGELTGLTAKRQEILDKITSTDIWQAHNGENSSYHEQSLMQKMETLSAEELDIVYKAVMEDGITTWNEMLAAISDYNSEQENTQTGAETLQTIFGDFWNSEDFADTREELQALAQTVTGITPENVEELAAESDELASMLALDGMNAEFLANILQTMARGGNGLALITSEALALNKALDGMTGAFDSVTAAKIRYDAAMSVEEKDTNFRSYAEAFAQLNEQFEAGTTNSNAFWAAAEFLFGSEQLTAWGWSDGLEEIRQAMEDNKSVFENADSAGAGFIERLYEMSEAGQLVNEKGEKLLEIQKTADGGYAFDVEPENIAAIATAMGITEEAALACFEALSMWGDVSFYDIEEVITTLEDIGFAAETSGGKAINVSLLTEQMMALGKTDKEIYDVLTALEACDGITLFGVTDDVNKLKDELIDLGLAADDGVTVSVNYEGLTDLMSQLGFTKEEAQETINLLGAADGITLTNASGEVKSVDDALAHLDTLTFANVTTSVGSISDAVADVDESSTDQVCGELANVGGAAEDATTKVYNLQTALDSLQSKEITVTYNVERKGGLLGVLGFAKGTKNAPAGEALVGEEGAELWQSGDQARLVGVNGPEIVNLNEGDRIYTNAQTRKMLGSSGKRLSGTIPAYRAGLNNQFAMVAINDGGGSISGVIPNGGISGVINPKEDPKKPDSDPKEELEEVGNTFEDLYKKHQHLRAMDQESQADYLAWLSDAYEKAYAKGEIELEDYYKYQEEVYQGLQDLFRDYLGDNEHLIDMLGRYDNTDGQIVGIYQSMMAEIEKEIAAARAAGMDDNDDYIQELQSKWMEYFDAVADIQEETTDAAKEAVEELVDYRIDMIKQELENERDALNEKLDYLKEFYDKQKEMLRDQYDHENYLRDQQEKRRSVTDIQAELEELRFDDSAWAQRRKLELEEELADAQDDLRQFEDEHALDMALDALDNAYNSQEEQIQAEMDALEDKLNDPNALYNLALEDIKNNSKDQLYYQMLMYNRQYGDGNDETVNELWESAYGALDDYARLFGELFEGIELSNETGVEEGSSWDESPISGTNPDNQPSESTNGGTADTLPGGTEPELKKGSQITVKDTATHFSAKSGGVRMASFVPGGKYTVYRTSGDEVLIGRNDVYTGWIKRSDIVGYASGTKHASAGLHRFDERGSEYIFSDQGGGKYRLFSSDEKVLDAKAASWLYDFATTRGLGIVDKLIASFASAGDDLVDGIVGATYGSGGNIARMLRGATDNKVINNNIDMSGDINIDGNADKQTVSEIRRAKREALTEALKEMRRLKN